MLDVGGHFLFVCKPESHKAIEEFRAGIILDERIDRVRNGKKWITRRYQWLGDVPLRGNEKAMTVNWLMIDISDDSGNTTYRNSFITDLERVVAVAARSRALVGKTGADLAQFPDQLLNGAHTALESTIESRGKRKSLHAVERHQEIHKMWHFGLRSRCDVITSATRSHLELLADYHHASSNGSVCDSACPDDSWRRAVWGFALRYAREPTSARAITAPHVPTAAVLTRACPGPDKNETDWSTERARTGNARYCPGSRIARIKTMGQEA